MAQVGESVRAEIDCVEQAQGEKPTEDREGQVEEASLGPGGAVVGAVPKIATPAWEVHGEGLSEEKRGPENKEDEVPCDEDE